MVQKKSRTLEKRPRGRPRQYDPDRVLDSAAGAFWMNGYAATSLDELSAATGMNRPSLYAAFGDKSDLYLKTLERYREQSRALARELVADAPTLRVFLARFYDKALDIYLAGDERARGCYIISTAATQATVDPAVRRFLAESILGTDAFLSNLIAKARDRGEIESSADPAALAQLATATLHALAVRARAGISRKQLTALARTTVDMICKPKSTP
jgi:TetR/AcrR family transcriptional regulator, copper-responsive repressor